MSQLLKEVKRRVLTPGAFANWRHESSTQARPDLSNLNPSAALVVDACRALPACVAADNRDRCERVAFAIMQNLYPIVEALDSDAGQYLGQAVEALRR